MKALHRSLALAIALAAVHWLAPPAFGADRASPAAHWAMAGPAAIARSAALLAVAERHFRAVAPTALMIVRDGEVLGAWGDVAREVNVRSVRKSLLGALTGIAVAEGRIRLDQTVGALGIDDRAPSLTDIEKQATVRDLLMARSGIYHPAAYESRAMAAARPPRGSHPPGAFWYYNNWDFNALGTIYERLTGQSVFEGFATRIAKPIGMQDFAAEDGRFVFERASDHPAYTMRLTARDLARLGLLFLDRGAWNGAQVVPADWVEQSTRAWSRGQYGLDYGYLWWAFRDADARAQPALAGATMALGHGGQGIAVIPALRLVVTQVVDVPEGRESSGGSYMFTELVRHVAAESERQ